MTCQSIRVSNTVYYIRDELMYAFQYKQIKNAAVQLYYDLSHLTRLRRRK